jgi:hypothetical protein
MDVSTVALRERQAGGVDQRSKQSIHCHSDSVCLVVFDRVKAIIWTVAGREVEADCARADQGFGDASCISSIAKNSAGPEDVGKIGQTSSDATHYIGIEKSEVECPEKPA